MRTNAKGRGRTSTEYQFHPTSGGLFGPSSARSIHSEFAATHAAIQAAHDCMLARSQSAFDYAHHRFHDGGDPSS
jgi:hypothetical protein